MFITPSAQAPYQLELLPERALLIRELHALVLSDVHLGKGAHFRRHGIAVPDGAAQHDLLRLDALVREHQLDVYVVGDLVHAGHNHEWERFATVRSTWSVAVHLILGNHDSDVPPFADRIGLIVHQRLIVGGLQFIHNPVDAEPSPLLTISGHLHPSVIVGKGTQFSVRLPCFHLTTRANGPTLLLPAFGEFTGMKAVLRQEGDKVFAVTASAVVEV